MYVDGHYVGTSPVEIELSVREEHVIVLPASR